MRHDAPRPRGRWEPGRVCHVKRRLILCIIQETALINDCAELMLIYSRLPRAAAAAASAARWSPPCHEPGSDPEPPLQTQKHHTAVRHLLTYDDDVTPYLNRDTTSYSHCAHKVPYKLIHETIAALLTK